MLIVNNILKNNSYYIIMKIALLISGYTRSLKLNIEKIYNFIINGNNVDIFMYLNNDDDKKYLNKHLDIKEIQSILNPKFIIISDNLNLNSNYNDIYNQNYKYFILNEKKKEIEYIEKFKYDIVIKFRPDTHLNQKLDFNIEKNIVYIPIDSKIDKSKLINKNDNYICDIIAYGKSDIMDKYFDFYLYINELIYTYGYINETLLYYYLIKYNIQYKLVDISYIVILSQMNTIAITGDSGTGKTTISNMLKTMFNNSFILECDRYHKWERGDKNWDIFTHLNPNANYITKMNNDVFDLKIGNKIFQVDYDHQTGKFTDVETIDSNDNIIICGLHSLYNNDSIIDIKIYLDIPDYIKIPWKIKRDIEKRGYSINQILENINKRKSDFIQYIEPQKYKADIIICLFNDIYDNKVINYYNFDYQQDIQYNFKIGLKSNDYISIINKINHIEKFDIDNNYIFLYYNLNISLEIGLKNIINNIYNNA